MFVSTSNLAKSKQDKSEWKCEKSQAHSIIFSGRYRRMLVTVADSAVYNNIARIFLGAMVVSMCFITGTYVCYALILLELCFIPYTHL